MTKSKNLAIVVALKDFKNLANQNKSLFNELSENFEIIYVMNFVNLKFLTKKIIKFENMNLLPKNFKIINFKDSGEVKKFSENKELTTIHFLGKSIEYFRIYFLLKKINSNNIMIFNIGNFGTNNTIEWNLKHIHKAYRHYYDKGFYYIFRILTIINLFPKIDLLFECNLNIIKNINNGFSSKIEKFFPLLKISYFRNIEKINSVTCDYFIENTDYKKLNSKDDYILFIDMPIDHTDRIKREGVVKKEVVDKYYQNLISFLSKISQLFGKKIIIALHPKQKSKASIFNKFEIANESTLRLIPQADIVIFSLSSAILNAVIFKKKIINIRSKCLGDFMTRTGNKYTNTLKILSIDIDKNLTMSKEDCLKKMSDALENYDNLIKTQICIDDRNISRKKIVKKIKQYFF
tara:strand:- start:2461 stop:3678 length:1218 start_codon:yes stop_codon:yes gene_type:complete